MTHTIIGPETFRAAADDDSAVVLSDPDLSQFASYEEYLAYEQAQQERRQADVMESAARTGELLFDGVCIIIFLWVLLEGSDVVASKLSRGF